MAYLGNQPALSYTSFAKQDFTTSATTSYTLDNPVANANELALFINFVRQEPTTAYSASGTSLTLTSATSASDDMYCVYLGKAVQTVNPPSASVGTAQIADLAVTSGKLASGVLPTNTPAFEAYVSADQTITDNVMTKIQFDTELFDTNSDYDNSTNYRFTPTVAGKYSVYANVMARAGNANLDYYLLDIYKNGSAVRRTQIDSTGIELDNINIVNNITLDFNGTTDYVEVFAQINDTSGNPEIFAGTKSSLFGAYKIIE
jgi:hypothetical protein